MVKLNFIEEERDIITEGQEDGLSGSSDIEDCVLSVMGDIVSKVETAFGDSDLSEISDGEERVASMASSNEDTAAIPDDTSTSGSELSHDEEDRVITTGEDTVTVHVTQPEENVDSHSDIPAQDAAENTRDDEEYLGLPIYVRETPQLGGDVQMVPDIEEQIQYAQRVLRANLDTAQMAFAEGRHKEARRCFRESIAIGESLKQAITTLPLEIKELIGWAYQGSSLMIQCNLEDHLVMLRAAEELQKGLEITDYRFAPMLEEHKICMTHLRTWVSRNADVYNEDIMAFLQRIKERVLRFKEGKLYRSGFWEATNYIVVADTLRKSGALKNTQCLADMHREAATLAFMQGLFDHSIHHCQQVLEFGIFNDVYILKIAAQSNFHLQKLQKSRQQAEKVLSLKPKDKQMRDLLAKIGEQQGASVTAGPSTAKTSDIDPDFLQGTNIGQHEKQRKQAEKAKMKFEQEKEKKAAEKTKKNEMKKLQERAEEQAQFGHFEKKSGHQRQRTHEATSQGQPQMRNRNRRLCELRDGGARRERHPQSNQPQQQRPTPVLPNTPQANQDVHLYSHSASSNTGRARPQPSQRAQKAKARTASTALLTKLIMNYEITLACNSCYLKNDSNGVIQGAYKYAPNMPPHGCQKNILLLRRHSGQGGTWQEIRQRPRKYTQTDGLCEHYVLKEECRERKNCPFPHNEEEKKLWDLGKECCISTFVEDLKNTSLKVEVELLCPLQKIKGKLAFVCQKCWNKETSSLKQRHNPLCSKKNHAWNSDALAIEYAAEDSENQKSYTVVYIKDKRDGIQLDNEVYMAVAQALQLSQQDNGRSVSLEVIVKNVNERLQSVVDRSKRHLGGTADRNSQRCSESDSVKSGDFEDLRVWNLEDAAADFENEEALGSSAQGEDIGDEEEEEEAVWHGRLDGYYEVYSKGYLKERLSEDPDTFKVCTIHLDDVGAKCKPVTEGGETAELIEVRGRMNCGPSLEGDEVVVEVMQTQVLDDESTVTRGKVVGIWNRRVPRKEYTFVCTVDQYYCHLMKPICGTAPKIHVMKTSERGSDLVTLYKYDKGTGRPQPERLIKISPRDRNNYVFVVKYLKWIPNRIYPLGYACMVLCAGHGPLAAQRILNLMYQVPSINHTFENIAAVRYGDGIPELKHNRKDLTGLYTMTIDPPDCGDIDDAVSIEELGKGIYSVGVHIADVSSFIEKDEPLDEEARRRVTSFYPSYDVGPHHMLPDKLSQDLCSLQENQERLTISVLFKIKDNGQLVEDPKLIRSKIKNRAKLCYREVEDMLNDTYPVAGGDSQYDDKLVTKVKQLHKLACGLSKTRQGDRRFFHSSDELFSSEDYPKSHRLIEELMVLTNQKVAEFLVNQFPDHTPVRKQNSPSKAACENWKTKFQDMSRESLYFAQYLEWLGTVECGNSEDNIGHHDTNSSSPGSVVPMIFYNRNLPPGVPLLGSTINQLKAVVDSHDLDSAQMLVAAENLHPMHALAMSKWFQIQEPATFVRTDGHRSEKDTAHFSLQITAYTQFTSPIRRYMDIVIHRMVIAALEKQDCPYDKTEIDEICGHVNVVNRRQKRYSKACDMLKVVDKLQQGLMYLPAVVANLDDGGMNLDLPHVQHLRRKQTQIKYSHLDVCSKPVVEDDTHTTLQWEKRLYDTKSYINCDYARTTQMTKQTIPLQANMHVQHVPLKCWENVQQSIKAEDCGGFEAAVKDMLDTLKLIKGGSFGARDVTSEMKHENNMVKHHCDFSLKVNLGGVMLVQLMTEVSSGMIQPSIQLLGLTKHVDICLEHMSNPVKCFAEIASVPTKQHYENIEEYKETWIPIIAMEAVTSAISDGDPIVLNNVPIKLEKRNKIYYGKFTLSAAFCKYRQIKLLKNSKDEENECQDLLCIRCPTGKRCNVTGHGGKWVGHAITTLASVKANDEKGLPDIQVDFQFHQSQTTPPSELLDSAGLLCTVELIQKTLPDKRMHDAIDELHEATDLARQIALGRKIPDPDPGWQEQCPKDLNIQGSETEKHLPYNNRKQDEAIRAALTQSFTLIQGPPGTGKTLTGIKLAYWFVELNKKSQVGTTKRQVLICGPSNSSVDVPTYLLEERLGKKCPKIVRVYSESLENLVFPIPRDSLMGKKKGRRYELLGKKENESIALHHLIRKPSNPFHKKILADDKLFAANMKTPEKVSDEKVEAYSKLITDASMHELKQYDIILCTCSASAGPRITRSANICQIIIDECGMCMEPETLVPLVSFKAEQVVLIGDHRQLQPIVSNSIAKELGLDKSLFERYQKDIIRLDEQYRMHPEICSFPAKMFYDNDLHTYLHYNRYWKGGPLDIWPNAHCPIVFCHLEGAEKTLTVSTEEGNEQSKSNMMERDEAVRIVAELVNRHRVLQQQVTVLSQYKAQCSEIKRNLKDYGIERTKVSTVVSSQGDEWDYVVLSTVRSMPEYEIDKQPSIGWKRRNMGFITDEHQINVALTRARRGLVILGNEKLLRCDEMWRKLLEHYKRLGCIVQARNFLRHMPDQYISEQHYKESKQYKERKHFKY